MRVAEWMGKMYWFIAILSNLKKLNTLINKPIIKFLFFGNYFYGICAVALSAESLLKQGYDIARIDWYLLVFCLTVIYYTLAYVKTEQPIQPDNERAVWYQTNKKLVRNSQLLLTLTVLTFVVVFLLKHHKQLAHLSTREITLAVAFPLASVLYYGSGKPGTFNLRNIGWLKPFVIGFTWAGMITVFPGMFCSFTEAQNYQLTKNVILLFINNFMFIVVLCIMFDIKDYAMDYNQSIKTFVVKAGLRKTIHRIIIPLCLAGLISFLLFAGSQKLNLTYMAINALPFAAILMLAYSLQKRKSIFYYLAIIDGVMLIKAVCGIISVNLS